MTDAPNPSLSTAPHAEGEGGGAPNRKTTIKPLRPEDVWQPRLGAPRGNRNAAKPLSTLEARVRDFKRRAKAAIRQARQKC